MVDQGKETDWIFPHVFESGEPTMVLDLPSMDLVAANPALAQLVDRQLEEIVGKKVDFLRALDGDRAENWCRHSRAELLREGQDTAVTDISVLFMTPSIICLRLDVQGGEEEARPSPLASKHASLYRSHRELQGAYNRLEFLNDQLSHRNHEIREIYRRLAYATKMAAIGDLVAGATHSINNPLAAAISANREALSHLRATESSNESIRLEALSSRIDRALRRIEEIVADLRRISKTGAHRGDIQSVSLNNEVQLALEFVRPRLGGVELRVEIPTDIRVRVAPDEFGQVIVNLVENALDALGDAGEISVKASTSKNKVELVVEDDGPGIPRDIVERVFEPFYTSKSPDEGTGIGLSVVKGVIEGYAGSIRVDTRSGKGARFLISLPREDRDG